MIVATIGCLCWMRQLILKSAPQIAYRAIIISLILKMREVEFKELTHSQSIGRKLKCQDSNSALLDSKPRFFPSYHVSKSRNQDTVEGELKRGGKEITTETFKERLTAIPKEGENSTGLVN